MASWENLDFSTIGNLPNIYRQARQQAVRERALGQLGQGGGPLDYGAAARAMLAAGDTEGGLSLARLAEAASRDQRDFGFRQQEAQRSQGNVDRSFTLQKEQADAAARGFEIRERERPDGTKELIRIEKATGRAAPLDGSGTTEGPANPFMTGGKMNEAQSKDALYASRMLASEKVLRSIDADVATNWMDKARGIVSDKIGYNIRSPEYQKFDQAQRDFINATLRRESGAVISDAEFDNARKQYFPQPGDTADIIKQKRANRMEAIRGIGAGAGPGYRPESRFDESGEIVPNARQPQRGAQPPVPGARQGRKPDGSSGWFIQKDGKTYLVE